MTKSNMAPLLSRRRAVFQALEKNPRLIPSLGKNRRHRFQALEKPRRHLSKPWKPRQRRSGGAAKI
jgi:hypothetical protein